MIKAVIFDFFGVLVTEGFKRFLDDYFPNDKEKRQQAIKIVTKHDSGSINQTSYQEQLAELADVDLQTIKDHMNSNKPNRLLLNYIRNELKPKYKVGILSNSGDDYTARLLDPGDVELFDDIQLSYRAGMVKPQREFYELAAQKLGVQPSEAVFVDDSPSHCHGASRAGMETVVYQDFAQFKKNIAQLLAASPNN